MVPRCHHKPGNCSTEREKILKRDRSLASGQLHACQRGSVLARSIGLYEISLLELVVPEVCRLSRVPTVGYDEILQHDLERRFRLSHREILLLYEV